MRFAHLSDLHIGKNVNGYSMVEDQKYILNEILNIIDSKKVQAVIIAGDVYDKAVPPAEAVTVLNNFLVGLSARKLPVFIISGNHDSAERLNFGSRFFEAGNIFISPVYNGETAVKTLTDSYGEVNIYMLPFIKPAHVKSVYPKEDIVSYTDAVKVAVEKMNIDTNARNILVTHQFVTGASRTESEEISVGGSDNVDVSAFGGFDYVAMGHIHRSQKCTYETVRYSGTPLKYSISEAKDEKSLTVVDIGEKGRVEIELVPLKPLYDIKEIKGTYRQLTRKSFYENTTYTQDYMHITLTDEEDVADAIGNLRLIYPRLMKLDYDNQRTRSRAVLNEDFDVHKISPMEMFEKLYTQQNGTEMSEMQKDFVQRLIEKIWEGEK